MNKRIINFDEDGCDRVFESLSNIFTDIDLSCKNLRDAIKNNAPSWRGDAMQNLDKSITELLNEYLYKKHVIQEKINDYYHKKRNCISELNKIRFKE